MKKIAKIVLAVIIILSLTVVTPFNNVKAQFSANISMQTFYNELSPYGQWIDDPEYGFIWVPDAGPGFRPYYSGGHWVMTGYGTMWVSDYSWGWAPFHYGRWVYTSYYGWVWIPDTTWGPGWVSWRWGNGYCGWAPLGPGISVNISFGSSYSVPYDWWVFVPQRYCLSPSFYNYRIAAARNTEYVRNTTIINNTYVNNNITYAAGPRVNEVEQVIGSKVPVYSVATVNKPGKTSVAGNAVRTYRPQVAKEENARPSAVVTKDQFIKNKPQRGTQPSQRIEEKSVQQQNNNGQVEQQRRQPINQPSPQIERKAVQQQNNNRQVEQQRRQPINQPSPQIEKKAVQQQNNNGQVEQQRRQQEISRPSEQKPQESRPVNRGKRKGDN